MKGVDGKENPAMQNVAVRKAVMEAIDRAALSAYPVSLDSGEFPTTDELFALRSQDRLFAHPPA